MITYSEIRDIVNRKRVHEDFLLKNTVILLNFPNGNEYPFNRYFTLILNETRYQQHGIDELWTVSEKILCREETECYGTIWVESSDLDDILRYMKQRVTPLFSTYKETTEKHREINRDLVMHISTMDDGV